MNDKLTREEIQSIKRGCESVWLDAKPDEHKSEKWVNFNHAVVKLCDMALAALNGPPAVDLGKVREALAEIDEANDNGGMCYSDKLHRAVQKLRSALPPAPTDHKEGKL